MSSTPPNEPWGQSEDQPRQPPYGYPPPGGYPGGGYPGGGYPGGGYPGGDYPEGAQGVLTGWWRRVGATVVDGLLIGIPVSIVFGAIGIAGYALSGIDDVALLLYQILLLGMPAGQTIGNRAVTSRVIDATTGGPIGPGRATARQLVQLVLNLTIIGGILDVFWPLWDRRNQTLHDKAANSLVVMAY